MPYALCPMPYALCPMPYALCPMPYIKRAPHVTEKGYIYCFVRDDRTPKQRFLLSLRCSHHLSTSQFCLDRRASILVAKNM
jgi:hypothetical protein